MDKIKLPVVFGDKTGDTLVGNGFHSISAEGSILTMASRYKYDGWVDCDDETLGKKERMVDCASIMKAEGIESIGFAYSSSEEVYYLSVRGYNGSVFFNVESREKAIECVGKVREWWLSVTIDNK